MCFASNNFFTGHNCFLGNLEAMLIPGTTLIPKGSHAMEMLFIAPVIRTKPNLELDISSSLSSEPFGSAMSQK